ncbi:MAG TPA: hypothetical protein VJS38_01835 [Phenylobacterium sp.]|uniref:hypothetical protein n=1 Tax=Phenylobacterium sp. TaxID=1871053 RepID=UPI002B48E263|nr:hypothetical protein [Phenylobacterium sp.]HKR86892.1 hypothetical protein [Phenylobacterium sp.]
MTRHLTTLATALALAFAASAAQAAKTENPRSCFPVGSAWQSWNADKTGDVLYLRVHINDIYRVDLTPGSRVYKWPGYFLVNTVRGSDWICSALDLDLTLASNYGYRKPLIAVSMRKLTPEEAAAIPPKERP